MFGSGPRTLLTPSTASLPTIIRNTPNLYLARLRFYGGGHGRPEADISTLNIGIILGHNGRIFSVVSEHALRINKKLDLIEHRLRCSHDSADR